MTLSPSELEAIEKRAREATPGPWSTEENETGVWAAGFNAVCEKPGGGMSDSPERWPTDRAFIAAARSDVPRLVEALRAAERRLVEVTEREAQGVAVFDGIVAEARSRIQDLTALQSCVIDDNARLRKALSRAEVWLMNDHPDNVEEALSIVSGALLPTKPSGGRDE